MFLAITMNGLAMGMVYALLALGLILMIRASGVLNMAQGDLLSIGAYITFYFGITKDMPLIPMLILSLLTFCAMAGVFLCACYLPVKDNKWVQARMVCTLGFSYIIKDALTLTFGVRTSVVPPLVRGNIKVFGTPIQIQYLFIIGICLVIMLLVWLLFDKMYCGTIMQAAAQNAYSGRLIGIPVTLTILATYMAVFCVAGLAGWLVVPTYFLTTNLATYQLRAFAGCVIGGLGDVRGAIIGSLLVGLIEGYSTIFSSTYKDVILYSIVLLVLIIKPKGLFASKQGVKV
ncbi:MAG: branched-chain amino acid ABC transporter permease [Clostridiaceae bacterium]|nr:branched-chain amino acid ABC transporter permease [Clostridiaceae bacterium]